MVTTAASKQEGSLFAYVVSRLRPDVFTHPIWVHFGGQEKPILPDVIDNLLSEAKQLRKDDPASACQIMVVCAVHLNYAGQRAEALTIMQNILALAEGHGLAEDIIWANWGTCAICFQKGHYEQAAGHLQRLQRYLLDQGEWILANFVETFEQSLLQYNPTANAGETTSSSDRTHASLMRLTFDWLGQWGFSTHLTAPEFQAISIENNNPNRLGDGSSQPLWSNRSWHRFWFHFRQIIQGELKLKWVANGAHYRTDPVIQRPPTYSPPSIPNKPEDSPPTAPRILSQDHHQSEPVPRSLQEDAFPEASLLVYCLGPFHVYQDEQSIDDWPSSKGKAVFKYLATHRERPVLKDVLMELFWPDIPVESARNNLNVAIYGLRQALRKTNPSFSHVLFENDCYLLNPELRIWSDYESFLDIVTTAHKLEERGKLEAAISEYSKAEALYQGEFLEEDRYEDWELPLRRNLNEEYLNLLDRLSSYYEQVNFSTCMSFCRKILAVDPCREDAHRRLMHGYHQHGHPHLAIRQYHICTDILKRELDVAPSKETTALYQQIRTGMKE